jgi:hypothetical protein
MIGVRFNLTAVTFNLTAFILNPFAVRRPYSWHPHVPNRHLPPEAVFAVRLNGGRRVRIPSPRKLSSSEDRLLPFSSSIIGP